jgi:small subunit ribosomal protein S12e
MSDDAPEIGEIVAEDAGVEEVAVEVEPVIPLDPETALKIVLKTSLYHDGLARGLHEAVKALDRREAHLCVLASSCNEPAYTKLITALCKEHSIPLIKVEDGKVLGEWSGLCKYNADGKAVRVVGASCVVVRSWGEETEARQYILEHIKSA